MKTTSAVLALLLAATAIAAGCAASDDDDGTDDQSAIRAMERRAVGPAIAYPADTYTDVDDAAFSGSKKERRKLGWHVLAKALKPVAIAEQKGISNPGGDKKIPLFRTWLGADEIESMFVQMLTTMTPDRRKAGDPPTDKELKDVFDWNATNGGIASEAEYFKRLTLITDQKGVDGLGGNGRTTFSPAYAKKFLTDYKHIADSAKALADVKLDTKPPSDKNFSIAFSSEFDADTAVVKASWRRNDQMIHDGLPVIDTSADALGKRVKGEIDNGGWNVSKAPLQPVDETGAYTVTMSDGSSHSLQSLHVMTKELRHWIWVTIWWSPKPDEDFGQDRPDEIKALGAPWDHYKMNIVTDFLENDKDPTGGFDGTLGASLAAVHDKNTWSSNANIEKGDHNAQSNCMGCHQHAGDVSALDKVLTDPAFAPQGRNKIRESFPADYTWALTTPASSDDKDRLLPMLQKRLNQFDGVVR